MGKVLEIKQNDRAERALLDAKRSLPGAVPAWRLIAEVRRQRPYLSERSLIRSLIRLERVGVLQRAKTSNAK